MVAGDRTKILYIAMYVDSRSTPILSLFRTASQGNLKRAGIALAAAARSDPLLHPDTVGDN